MFRIKNICSWTMSEDSVCYRKLNRGFRADLVPRIRFEIYSGHPQS
jgi:hypothetical protein